MKIAIFYYGCAKLFKHTCLKVFIKTNYVHNRITIISKCFIFDTLEISY